MLVLRSNVGQCRMLGSDDGGAEMGVKKTRAEKLARQSIPFDWLPLEMISPRSEKSVLVTRALCVGAEVGFYLSLKRPTDHAVIMTTQITSAK